jgi:hypothetical protein
MNMDNVLDSELILEIQNKYIGPFVSVKSSIIWLVLISISFVGFVAGIPGCFAATLMSIAIYSGYLISRMISFPKAYKYKIIAAIVILLLFVLFFLSCYFLIGITSRALFMCALITAFSALINWLVYRKKIK